jgi:4-hydroxy-tetrahydrodipicolinate synthase
LAGLKDSAGKWERTEELIKTRRPLKVFPGSDELLARGLAAGSVGCISGTANAFPELVAGVRRAHEETRDLDGAQARLDAAKNILLTYPLIAVSKSILARQLRDSGTSRMSVRPPLVDLTPEQERRLFQQLEAAGLL